MTDFNTKYLVAFDLKLPGQKGAGGGSEFRILTQLDMFIFSATFQAIITTNGTLSFAIFLYESITQGTTGIRSTVSQTKYVYNIAVHETKYVYNIAVHQTKYVYNIAVQLYLSHEHIIRLRVAWVPV